MRCGRHYPFPLSCQLKRSPLCGSLGGSGLPLDMVLYIIGFPPGALDSTMRCYQDISFWAWAGFRLNPCVGEPRGSAGKASCTVHPEEGCMVSALSCSLPVLTSQHSGRRSGSQEEPVSRLGDSVCPRGQAWTLLEFGRGGVCFPGTPLKGEVLPADSLCCSGKGSNSHLFALHKGPEDTSETGVVFTPSLDPMSLV